MLPQKIECSLQYLVDCILHGRAYGIISEKDEIYSIVGAMSSNDVCVIENSQWSVGYGNDLLPQLESGLFRLWNKADWINSQNRNRIRIAELNQRLEQRKAQQKLEREKIAEWLKKAGTPQIAVDMLLAANSDEQIHAMYAALPESER